MPIRAGENIDTNIIKIIGKILNCEYLSIYWFFLSLFAIYLCIPVLGTIPNKIETFKYIIVVGILFRGILPLLCNILGIEFNQEMIPPVVRGYLLYPCLGYYLANIELTKKTMRMIYVAGLFGWILHFFGTIVLSTQDSINQLFKGYVNIPCIMYSAAVFVFFKNRNVTDDNRMKMIEWIAKRTFGIYLVHIYIIKVIDRIVAVNVEPYRFIWTLVEPVLIFAVSFLIVWFMQRVKFLRFLTP